MFADKDTFGIAAGEFEDVGIDQAVVKDHVGLLQPFDRA